ncbi:MAG: hypothetical protein FJZ11_06955 [Candidatus Omnitrophica bacterium]|nr:hypothetical protein [Candidatus Omnitrophota bacterium]
MKLNVINAVLIMVFILLIGAVILPFVAEIEFDKAKKLETDYRWQKAGEKYRMAIKLNPFNAEYFAEVGNFLFRQSNITKDDRL